MVTPSAVGVLSPTPRLLPQVPTHLPTLLIRPPYGLQQPLTRFRIMDEGIPLRPVHELEVLRSRLTIDGPFWHG
jgi:hypothetical protein